MRDAWREGGSGEEGRGFIEKKVQLASASFRDKCIPLQPCDAHGKYHVSTEESRARGLDFKIFQVFLLQ